MGRVRIHHSAFNLNKPLLTISGRQYPFFYTFYVSFFVSYDKGQANVCHIYYFSGPVFSSFHINREHQMLDAGRGVVMETLVWYLRKLLGALSP